MKLFAPFLIKIENVNKPILCHLHYKLFFNLKRLLTQNNGYSADYHGIFIGILLWEGEAGSKTGSRHQCIFIVL